MGPELTEESCQPHNPSLSIHRVKQKIKPKITKKVEEEERAEQSRNQRLKRENSLPPKPWLQQQQQQHHPPSSSSTQALVQSLGFLLPNYVSLSPKHHSHAQTTTITTAMA